MPPLPDMPLSVPALPPLCPKLSGNEGRSAQPAQAKAAPPITAYRHLVMIFSKALWSPEDGQARVHDVHSLLVAEVPGVLGVEILERQDQVLADRVVDASRDALLRLDRIESVGLGRDEVVLGREHARDAVADVERDRIEVQTEHGVVAVELARARRLGFMRHAVDV